MKTNKLGHEILRERGQFQLCVDNSAGLPTYYIDNSILIEFTKGKGRSYNFDEEKKTKIMRLDDSGFVRVAKQAAGNDIMCLEVAKGYWERLGDIPVNENDEIEEDFVAIGKIFFEGTDKLDIWHWFESAFNISVAKDLMGLE